MAQIAPDRVAAIMLSWHGLELVSCRRIQTLWAGYGSICEVRARRRLGNTAEVGAEVETEGGDTLELILKLIVPPSTSSGGSGRREDEGHLRKMLSYEVEQYFYEVVAPRLSSSSSSSSSQSSAGYRPAIARCIATTRDMDGKPGAEQLQGGSGIIAMLITDLRPEFPIPGEKRAELSETQVYAALDWLAGFHGLSRAWVPLEKEGADQLVRPPLEEAERRRILRGGGHDSSSGKSKHGKTTVWLNGGYTYLATRRTEYATLVADADSEWAGALCRPYGGGPSVAERVAAFLAPRGGGGDAGRRPYESYIHGDVKSENLFATASGSGDRHHHHPARVAFFDFQYVGLGLGVCDLAKLFTCSVPLRLLTTEEEDDGGELGMDAGERRLLEHYRRRLREIAGFDYDWGLLVRHWEAALVDWLRFQMSWGAWGNTAWLQARVRSILRDDGFREWLLENLS
ncbi:hypothetical protein SLS62_008878 [Diatrype stigma]|uniref:Aminoglycoside phosphotransferase domain-containing protein n=1 Tax=Diatrype stigma TaxID=117547 RepID=A0AAN9UPL2_9PEZI